MKFWKVWNDERKGSLIADCILTDKLYIWFIAVIKSYKALLFNAGKSKEK